MTDMTLNERLAAARTKAARKAHQDRIADRRAVAEMNRRIRADAALAPLPDAEALASLEAARECGPQLEDE